MAEMFALRALGALLSYPGAELRAALPEIAAALAQAPWLPAAHRLRLEALLEDLGGRDPYEVEARYVELFDRGRATSLHLFEHLYGDSRERGPAMVALKALYARAGLRLNGNELPDYLPVLLEYLSCQTRAEARAMLGDCAAVLRAIGRALKRRGSAYAAVLEALLAVAGVEGLGASPEDGEAEVPDLDRDWAEPPAFDGSPAARAGRARGRQPPT
ncbi:nitrate reductase molybdenum cofactor assembly chaperone [Candidatus Methylocalor cossyra]|uniref:Nitrate reductase molybdenum cofactor assembly chaperone n=1 Tax=Candidatus Methylocalor cossyra TaxID=3108543 RepID=A0ABM9NGC2_9GAMM